MTRDVNVLAEVRSLRHTPECATGSRAETRGSCNCGAAERPAAWTAQILDDYDEHGEPLVRITTEAMTCRERLDFRIFGMDAVRDACDAIARRRRTKTTKAKKRKD